MATAKELNKILLGQDFPDKRAHDGEYDEYLGVARHYAAMENAVAVLSDMAADGSYVCYGGFAKRLGLRHTGGSEYIRSIWESEILALIHPDDLRNKYLQELRFYRFMKRRPPGERGSHYLAGKLRMKDISGVYRPTLHRMFYIPDKSGDRIRFALCLYSPLVFDVPAGGMAINSLTGESVELGKRDDSGILTGREKQILGMIAEGRMSKDIADALSISVNTVSRHRQEILKKLQVRNSIEACRIASELEMI